MNIIPGGTNILLHYFRDMVMRREKQLQYIMYTCQQHQHLCLHNSNCPNSTFFTIFCVQEICSLSYKLDLYYCNCTVHFVTKEGTTEHGCFSI